MPQVSRGLHDLSMATNLVRYPFAAQLFVKPESGGGLLLPRHVTPLSRRHVVCFSSRAYRFDCWRWPKETAVADAHDSRFS